MKVGIPKEIKSKEYRVSATPAMVREFIKKGHSVFVEKKAGEAIGFLDEDYKKAGANLLDTAAAVFEEGEMIVKVKEPQPQECAMLRENQILFTYLHLASDLNMVESLLERGVCCIAYETIKDKFDRLPLLVPMSQVAGRLAIQAGAFCLEKKNGGKGILLSGVPGTERGKVVIIGGGVVGINSALIATGFGADVIILDKDTQRLTEIENIFGSKIKTIYSDSESIERHVKTADICVGSVLIPGAKAPKLVTKKMVQSMENGSVLVDVAIDQGGCFETSKATTHEDPVYEIEKKVHYCVTNMPGAVARTATQALTNSTFPYIMKLADKKLDALKTDSLFMEGLNLYQGKIVSEPVAISLDKDFFDPRQLLN